jgi:hypothetical protein
MIDNQEPREQRQQPAPTGKVKKAYQKPAFRHEHVFETRALQCGKVAATQGTCQFHQNAS